MKKLYSLVGILFCFFAVYAQTNTDTDNNSTTAKTRTQTINELTETIIEKEPLYTLTISYTKSIDEAYFAYSINSALFEQGDAMKAIRLRIDKFVKEHGYYFYTYIGADVTKYDNANEVATYTSHIKLLTKNNLSTN